LTKLSEYNKYVGEGTKEVIADDDIEYNKYKASGSLIFPFAVTVMERSFLADITLGAVFSITTEMHNSRNRRLASL
jgi:acyl-CoA thioesterase FadM